MPRPLSPLESSALATIAATQSEADGWLDLTRICSRTGRHLVDVRQAVARLVRRRLVELVPGAPHTRRWLHFRMPAQTNTPTHSA